MLAAATGGGGEAEAPPSRPVAQEGGMAVCTIGNSNVLILLWKLVLNLMLKSVLKLALKLYFVVDKFEVETDVEVDIQVEGGDLQLLSVVAARLRRNFRKRPKKR